MVFSYTIWGLDFIKCFCLELSSLSYILRVFMRIFIKGGPYEKIIYGFHQKSGQPNFPSSSNVLDMRKHYDSPGTLRGMTAQAVIID